MKAQREIKGPFRFVRHAIAHIDARLPEMFRGVQFNREEINQEERIIPVVFATENPVDRWFGRERLICTSQACNYSRANNLGAFLKDHNSEEQIGVIVKDSVTFGADRKARSRLRFSKNSPLAEQEWKDVLDGIRGLFSVGYQVNRLLLREEDDTKGNLYEATDWEILEISLVSVPADVDCILDESREKDFTFPVRVVTNSETPTTEQETMLKRSKYFARFAQFNTPPGGNNNPEGGNPEGGGQGGGGTRANPPAAPTAEQARAAIAAETTRVRELGAIGARFGCMEEMVRRMNLPETDGERTVEAAYKYCLDNGLQDATKRKKTPAGGAAPLLTGGAAGERAHQPLFRSIGAMLVESEQYKAFKKGTPYQRSGVEFADLIQFRATVTTASISADEIILPDRLPGVQMLLQQRLTIADLLAQGQTASNKIQYIQETSYTNAAAGVNEGATKPEASFEVELAEASVRKIAVTAKISDEMLEDWPYIQSYVDSRLSFMVQEREELELLLGDGNAPNITGLLNTADIQTQAMGTDSAVDAIYKAITKIRVTAKVEPDGVVIHPNDWEDIRLTKDANGQYLAGGPFYAPYGQGQFTAIDRIWGLPTVVTSNMTENTALVGAFRTQAQVFRRKGLTIEMTNSNEDDFKKNLVAIRAEERLALCVYRPEAFCTVTGI
jgi:HK97 family phage major capsid protein